MTTETQVTQLATRRMQLADHMRNIWYVTPEAGTPIDALLDPKYWAHVSAKFKPRDRIEADAEDGSYFAELMVIDAGRLFAKVKVLRQHEFSGAEVTSIDLGQEYDIKWAGRHAKWRVVRKSDGNALKEGFEDRQTAAAWAIAHAKALAA